MNEPAAAPSLFEAPFAPPDEELAAAFLADAARDAAAEQRIDTRAHRLIEAIRARTTGLGGVEDFLHAYSLSTKEGLALMVLAEALLRVPDTATADRLIEDKLAAGRWLDSDVRSTSLLVSASAWTLGVAARIIHPGDTPETILDSVVRRIGLPTMRAAIRQAMRLLGSHFVIGQTIGEALTRARSHTDFRYSFDMLGEGARTAADADHYFEAYSAAISAIGAQAGNAVLPARPGISVKLSALHPRYEAISRDRVRAEAVPRLIELARLAKADDLQFTIDAEEADRLELSLEVIADVLDDPSLEGWDGFGLAVQAYQKRALAVIDWVEQAARAKNRRLTVRLVKGAYWDTEIKRAQERGLADYPVFTRKAMTDLCYMACARKLLATRAHLFPQFATHNALTVASIIEDAGGIDGFEFQRLYGMGQVLYDRVREEFPDAACRIYAPVGGHRDLLAYLVRRLLENGANSSFVAVAADPKVPITAILCRPQSTVANAQQARNRNIPLPRDLYQPVRRNSAGIDFGDRAALDALLREVHDGTTVQAESAPLIDGIALPGIARNVFSPIDGSSIGTVREADEAIARSAVAAATAGFADWSVMPVEQRAAILDRAGDVLERNRGRLIALLQTEGGKTIDDALAELREAVDYCRYYAAQARVTLAPQPMPGPTGESNVLRYRGRGVFICISPWNFPLAIFLGQITAALVAGNTVAAKPAEQTPLIAALAVALLHEAGVPTNALHLLPGDGKVGALLTADQRIAGVVFTGSTEVGRIINRTLAAKDGPIVPLIAETGGINAMVVDATALPEQVTDDVMTSAFRSAGQRCSALRLLCLQDDVADRILAMVVGAAQELKLGDPRALATHIGPVIDADAKEKLDEWISRNAHAGRVRFQADDRPPAKGFYVAPTIVELDRARELKDEVFGPVLHVVRWRADALDTLLDDIEGNGTALTLGVHSRIDATAARVAARLSNGNVYVNRSTIGAVVGTQPFGGTHLSGTGPKAGGPNYLRRLATEQTVSINTAAAGGNAGLLAQDDQQQDE
ncbi:MAG TPA: bifunctional proline dehydrogenase/L-glutamate gamma-semialdehyde dehydrogenase PutA [Xanthobacteraceae bacterium]|jgi:RHH-type proline utilization regulon transcriptional repressor/proline dehydrogenase/delta 1-pyrroline-5-carboxylate dehydrogenase|nr:bifunctional proline dehydrogenase/L-glutamate gamma-semialdehyde dehydrogenase PutA [Xanthobacteraceae bacterium]